MPCVILQATHFAISGQRAEGFQYASGPRRSWPYFTAYVYNGDGSVLDSKAAWDWTELYRWIESFGFRLGDGTELWHERVG